ncbi:hypothetical protein ACFL9T_05595 [Thermodesulfobacteriota bacterium]
MQNPVMLQSFSGKMAEAFQPAINLARNLAVPFTEPVKHILPGLPPFRDMNVLHIFLG